MKKLFALLMIAVASSNLYIPTVRADEECGPNEWLVWDEWYQRWACVPVGCWIDPVSHDIICNPR